MNTEGFEVSDLTKAKYKVSPLDDGTLTGFKVVRVPVTKMTRRASFGDFDDSSRKNALPSSRGIFRSQTTTSTARRSDG